MVPAWRELATVRALLMSLVNTAAARPYVVLLALSMTSLISLNLKTDITGPNICQFEEIVILDLSIYLIQTQGNRLRCWLIWHKCQRDCNNELALVCWSSIVIICHYLWIALLATVLITGTSL